MNMQTIDTKEQLRQLYPPAKGRALTKQLPSLDKHSRRFIELSPFVVLATKGADGLADATPRGGTPGFVQIEDDKTILLPDWPGNNRLDSLENIIDNPGIGLLFMVPGVNETLRLNGRAEIVIADDIRERFDGEVRRPKAVIRLHIEEAYLHCAKALMRSHLWDDKARNERAVLPTMGQMINDQTNTTGAAESQEEMEKRYAEVLY
jgi:uncharacterized protein